MPLGHINNEPPRRFRNSNNPGGSKPGKPQTKYPVVVVAVAEAIITRAKGTTEAWDKDRRSPFSRVRFEKKMEAALPGIWEFLAVWLGPRVTPYPGLLYNRAYKMHYSGTSDRGTNHDKTTRASMSHEHVSHRVSPSGRLYELYDEFRTSKRNSCKNWRDYFSLREKARWVALGKP